MFCGKTVTCTVLKEEYVFRNEAYDEFISVTVIHLCEFLLPATENAHLCPNRNTNKYTYNTNNSNTSNTLIVILINTLINTHELHTCQLH